MKYFFWWLVLNLNPKRDIPPLFHQPQPSKHKNPSTATYMQNTLDVVTHLHTLPGEIRQATSLVSFKSSIKTFL